MERMPTSQDKRNFPKTRYDSKKKNSMTYVKSCRITLAGINGISTLCFWLFSQSKMFSTSLDFTWKPSQLRTADSNSTLIEYGRRAMGWYIKQIFLKKCQLVLHYSNFKQPLISVKSKSLVRAEIFILS